jgi:dTDP-4-dehydrorhamnose reductase
MMADRRVLVIGSKGQVGSALCNVLPGATGVGRRDLDLGSPELAGRAGELFDAVRADAVVNCAAFTGVDRAEDEEQLADAVNGKAVGVLASVAAARGIPFVTYSTDYVFDGTKARPYVESDATSPINAYGRSKLKGETLALTSGGDALIIRTSWVVSGTHPNFVATMLRLASRGKEVPVVADQHGCPTIALDLAGATVESLERETTGILHLTNRGETTWFDLARAVVAQAGLDESLIQPCTTAEYVTAAPRPRYSVLGSERAPQLGIQLPPWQQSIGRVVADLGSRAWPG